MDLSRRHALQAAGFAALLAGVPIFELTAAPPPASAAPAPDDRVLKLWYRAGGRESSILQEGLPIGNGRLGALVVGDPDATTLIVSDQSLWSGGANAELDGSGQYPYDNDPRFGTLQMLAKVRIALTGHTANALTEYERRLDLSNGVLVVSYRYGGVAYRQEYFLSRPHDVLVIRLTQSGGGSLTGSVRLEGTHGETVAAVPADRAAGFAARLDNGLAYAAGIAANTVSGTATAAGSTVSFSRASEVTIVVSGGTDYGPDWATGYRSPGTVPADVARSKRTQALTAGGAALFSAHIADHQAQFSTFDLNLGASTAAQRAMDTGARLAARASSGTPDPELEALYLHYARYLAIAGSRGGLPMGLQGPWIDSNSSPWYADYHTDINVQMNYWLPDRVGLGASFMPFAEWCLSQYPSWQKRTAESFQDPRNRFRNRSGRVAGWTTAYSENIFGGHGWWWHPAGNAWLMNSLFQHWQYTRDTGYLRRIMPMLRGACEFWEARLVETTATDPTTGAPGKVLFADLDWSPEHGPDQRAGNSYQQEIVHDLFVNYLEAAAVLGVDSAYAATVSGLRARLYLPEVSPTTGWFQEWNTPENLGETTHRHLSPLVGLFPGERLRWDATSQKIVDGVRNLLVARSDGGYGWATAWRIACWARLHDADRAYSYVAHNLAPTVNGSSGTAVNLFDIYGGGIFQIDANFGTPTGIVEMLVGNSPGVVDLLPALPSAWATGSVRGVGIKGGFALDMAWANGWPTAVTVRSTGGTSLRVRFGGWEKTVTVAAGGSASLTPPARDASYRIVNAQTGLDLTVNGGGSNDGATIIQWPDAGSTNQRWRIVPQSADGLVLDSVRSGKRVDVLGGASAEGSAVAQWTPSASALNQRFRLVDAGEGRVKIVSRNSGKVLGLRDDATGSGTPVVIQSDTGRPGQFWRVTAV